jgi:hypothetical protein
MVAKLPCRECGELILPFTAERTGGLCMPCKQGTRKQIDEAIKWREEQRNLVDPFRGLWLSLVNKVHKTAAGYEGLTESEKLYFSVGLLEGEVYNGGFHQYFFNSSASYFDDAIRGLDEIGAVESLTLLRTAKESLFPSCPIPSDTSERRETLPWYPPKGETVPDWCKTLDELDKRFCQDPDGLGQRLQKYAADHQLVSRLE